MAWGILSSRTTASAVRSKFASEQGCVRAAIGASVSRSPPAASTALRCSVRAGGCGTRPLRAACGDPEPELEQSSPPPRCAWRNLPGPAGAWPEAKPVPAVQQRAGAVGAAASTLGASQAPRRPPARSLATSDSATPAKCISLFAYPRCTCKGAGRRDRARLCGVEERSSARVARHAVAGRRGLFELRVRSRAARPQEGEFRSRPGRASTAEQSARSADRRIEAHWPACPRPCRAESPVPASGRTRAFDLAPEKPIHGRPRSI